MKTSTLIFCAWNLLFFCGALLLAYGFWLAWKPLGFIVAGLFAAVLGYGGNIELVMKGGRRR